MARRENKSFVGYPKCPEWLKKIYRKSCNYTCMLCHKHEDVVGKLTPHRLKRGYKDGLYTVCNFSDKQNNIKMVDKECHKILHSNEFGHISHSY